MHGLKLSNLNKTKLYHMEQSTTTPPKLSFDSVPLHWSEPSGLATPPPCRVPAAIPFLWEEEPGRPRKESIFCKTNQKPRSARSLELPPRIVAEEYKTTARKKTATSPTSALDVSYSISRLRSLGSRYSFNKGKERRSQGDRRQKNARKGDVIWFQEEQRMDSNRDSNSSSSSLSFYTSSCCRDEVKKCSVKITRLKRQRSLIDVSVHATSHLLLGIYKSLRQIIPWHRT